MEVRARAAARGPRAGDRLVERAACCAACCPRSSPSRWARSSARSSAAATLAAPLALVGVVFVLLQVLAPIHQALGANLGSRTAAWLYDQLTAACVRPPGMGHLENPELADDLTMARDFDLGISGPPLSISMDFIASGLVEHGRRPRLGAGARRLRVVGAAPARRRLARDALAAARERRLARPRDRGGARGAAPRGLRLPARGRPAGRQGAAPLRARGLDRRALPRAPAAPLRAALAGDAPARAPGALEPAARARREPRRVRVARRRRRRRRASRSAGSSPSRARRSARA